jgi:hypothetical protein
MLCEAALDIVDIQGLVVDQDAEIVLPAVFLEQ